MTRRRRVTRLRYWRRLRYRWHDWRTLTLPVWVCKVRGHDMREPVRKFGGEILCPRCSAQIGRWSA